LQLIFAYFSGKKTRKIFVFNCLLSFDSLQEIVKYPDKGYSSETNENIAAVMAQIARKVKKLASTQLFNLKVLLNGRGLSKFKKRYKLHGELGRGGFGIVYRGFRICDELPVAVKFIDRNQVRDWGKMDDERVPMEICMLARCVNVLGVIKLLDWYSTPEGFLIVMERPYPCVDLFDFIKSHKKLDEDLARFLFRQIAFTIRKCAQQKVLHRDLKDENIVIDLVTGETSLIDFGAATVLKKGHYTDFQGAASCPFLLCFPSPFIFLLTSLFFFICLLSFICF
uniref:non-specific serine/threonine protein kinase n=1 Tax=Gongylonema pulchrum TaxID=637853 RepID=A0A183DWC3_9BILA